MSQTTEAIYENGIFKPLNRVNLPDGTRVRIEVVILATDPDKQIRQQLLSEGASPEAIERALATLHQLENCFEGLTEEQLKTLDTARLNQSYFFNRPED